MKCVKFIQSRSAYIDCRTLVHFKKGNVYDINDTLANNYLRIGVVQIFEKEKPIIEKVANPVIEDKTNKKLTKRRKKKAE